MVLLLTVQYVNKFFYFKQSYQKHKLQIIHTTIYIH